MIPKTTNNRPQPKGYFGIGILNLLSEENLGTLFRSAVLFNASFIFTIGKKYKLQKTDTLKSYKEIPLFQYDDFNSFKECIPKDCKIVGVEINDKATCLTNYNHFERSVYLLGSESKGLTKEAIDSCHDLIYIPSLGCLNVSSAGTVVLYDRISKNINS